MLRLPLLGLALAVALGAPAQEAAAARSARVDPVSALADRMTRLRTGKAVFDEKTGAELRGLVGDAHLVWSVEPAREPEAARALLDVYGAFLGAQDRPGPPSLAVELRERAGDALRERLDVKLAAWIAREIVPSEAQPIERRLGAIRLLREQTQDVVLLALLSCTQKQDPRLRREALSSLAGWHDPAVHGVFLRELRAEIAGEAGAEGALAERHFAQIQADPARRFLPELEPLVKTGLVAQDWRAAARAVALSRPFGNEAILPHLIEALSLWKARGPGFGHSLRMQIEIERELQTRSGRSFGLDPAIWRKWWAAVRAGELPRTGAYGQVVAQSGTKASFFGLKPTSDRIAFVIDRSQSMEGPMPGGGTGRGFAQRRWDEAVRQFLAFLEAAGPESRFDVVLFHDYAQAWKSGVLAHATPENIALVREWLAVNVPHGGTQLRMGVEKALMVDPEVGLRLAHLEADTVVVLCDGETSEGPGWVERFLADVNSQARVVFHGVQIGGRGDGTLEALARGSGGEFVHVPD